MNILTNLYDNFTSSNEQQSLFLVLQHKILFAVCSTSPSIIQLNDEITFNSIFFPGPLTKIDIYNFDIISFHWKICKSSDLKPLLSPAPDATTKEVKKRKRKYYKKNIYACIIFDFLVI